MRIGKRPVLDRVWTKIVARAMLASATVVYLLSCDDLQSHMHTI